MSITPLEPGTPAPALRLLDEAGRYRDRDEWLGQWLCVWWNPAALIKVGCTSCGQRVSDAVRPLLDRRVAVVGVTMDTPAVNAEQSLFVFESLFPILSADRPTAIAWSAARPQESPWADVPHPISYLVRPADGVIERSWIVAHDSPQHVNEVIDSLTLLPA